MDLYGKTETFSDVTNQRCDTTRTNSVQSLPTERKQELAQHIPAALTITTNHVDIIKINND